MPSLPHHAARQALPALLPAALFLLTLPAGAQVVYPSRTLFDAANPGLTAFNFSGIAPVDGFVTYAGNEVSLKGVTFSQPGNSAGAGLYAISKGYYASIGTPYALDDGDFLQAAGDSPTELAIALPTNTTAFGADFGTFNGSAVEVFVNGQQLLAPLLTSSGGNGGSFFGYTSATAITSLTFVDPDSSVLNINDVEFGVGAPVPEASSALSLGLLLSLGLAGAAWTARRKKAV